MRKWVMTMVYFTNVEFEVEAETYDKAVEKAYEKAADFSPNVKNLGYSLEDYDELPNKYDFADGYYDDPDDDDEEEFEPGRPYVDVMGLNP